MNCQDFDRRLDALLDAACGEDEWREAETHLAACPRCRTLFEGAAGRGGSLDEAAQASLTASVMARTARGACETARGRLCDFVDGVLDDFDRELVEGHLAHCEPCAELAGALAMTAAVLPSFAIVPPPPAFLAAVLAATSIRKAGPSRADRVAAWLSRAAMRPRFSLEVAYVCTLLLAVVFGNPVKAFMETASKGAAFAQPRVEVAVERIAAPLAAARATGETVVSRAVGRLAPARPAVAEPTGLMEWVQQWWEDSVARRARSVLGVAAGWLQSAQRLANDLAAQVMGKEPAAQPPAGEPARGAVR